MEREDAERALRALIEERLPGVGVTFQRTPGRGFGLSWDGHHLRPAGATLESQLHDVAHLLVAPVERLDLPEFGLGPDPYRRSLVARSVPEDEAMREELDAVTLQLAIAHLLELDVAAIEEEVQTTALTKERLLDLRARRPWAFPEAWWRRALDRLEPAGRPIPRPPAAASGC